MKRSSEASRQRIDCQWYAGRIGTSLVFAVSLTALLFTSTLLRADDHNVDLDKDVDFSKLKSFMIRPGRIDSGRQELNNSIVMKKIVDAVRTALLSKGLTEASTQPDVIVDFLASGGTTTSDLMESPDPLAPAQAIAADVEHGGSDVTGEGPRRFQYQYAGTDEHWAAPLALFMRRLS
jgi:hypothetical protein